MKKSGFTIIELMIVIAIIAILAAIAIPNLLRSRLIANEGAAVGTLRQISSAQQQYRATEGHTKFADSFQDLKLNFRLDPGQQRQGYTFSLTTTGTLEDANYYCLAKPTVPYSSGRMHFSVDKTGQLKQSFDEGHSWATIED